ncbi:MAG: CatB-related O-acetyltransferase [Lachnospiraceae bacterium]
MLVYTHMLAVFTPLLTWEREVEIGSYCSFVGNLHYFGANHPMDYITTSAYFYNKSFSGFDVVDVPGTSLIISDDVWIGYGVIITSGCKKIGRGSVIGAGSIVTKDVDPYTIVAGNLGKMIRRRFTEDEIRILEVSKRWTKSPQELYQYYPFMGNVRKFVEEITRN